MDYHFQRLSNLETQIIYWLAINREPVTERDLKSDMITTVAGERIAERLENLTRRSLVEKTITGFTLQPVIMEYVTQKLIDETIKVWDFNTGECLKTLRSPKLYENLNITGISGLTSAQKMTLKALGAIEQI